MPVPRTLLIAVALLGCTPKNKHLGKVAGGALAITGGLIIAIESQRDCGNADTVTGAISEWGCETKSATKMGIGILAAAIGATIFTFAATTPDGDEPWAPPTVTPPTPIAMTPTPETTEVPLEAETVEVDPMLKQLTIQASVAARRGDCLTVQAIAARIDEMDRVYRYSHFMGDDVTASCLK